MDSPSHSFTTYSFSPSTLLLIFRDVTILPHLNYASSSKPMATQLQNTPTARHLALTGPGSSKHNHRTRTHFLFPCGVLTTVSNRAPAVPSDNHTQQSRITRDASLLQISTIARPPLRARNNHEPPDPRSESHSIHSMLTERPTLQSQSNSHESSSCNHTHMLHQPSHPRVRKTRHTDDISNIPRRNHHYAHNP